MPTKGGLTYGAEVAQFVEDPQPGAYFTDSLAPVCFIEAREPHSVCVRKPDCANGVWADNTEWMLLDDFTKWLRYGVGSSYWVEHQSRLQWLEATAETSEGERSHD